MRQGAEVESVVTDPELDIDGTDLEEHSRLAAASYALVRGQYVDLASVVDRLLRDCLESEGIVVQSIQSRAKELHSFAVKAAREDEQLKNRPRYADPLNDIEDLAGCRIITSFVDDVDRVKGLISEQFDVIEEVDRSTFLRKQSRLGYESYHFVVRLRQDRLDLPEYQRFAKLKIEFQVRTILQHAWAEIEHDIQYKSSEELPAEIRRRFTALAGLIELGDREFQGIADAYEELKRKAVVSIEEGNLSEVEITPDSLKKYADGELGPDGRMKTWGYAWMVRRLKSLGFENLQQVAECTSNYDTGKISQVFYGRRVGQLTRLDDLVLAGMGQRYVSVMTDVAPDDREDVEANLNLKLSLLEAEGIPVGSYRPAPARDPQVGSARAAE